MDWQKYKTALLKLVWSGKLGGKMPDVGQLKMAPVSRKTQSQTEKDSHLHTVDGSNPAPVDR